MRQLRDQVAVMNGGQIVQFGERDQIFSAPHREYTRTLLNAAPGLDGRRQSTEVRTDD